MSDDEIEKARKAGEEMGELKTRQFDHGRRIGRLETGILAIVGSIVAAWAKSRGLW